MGAADMEAPACLGTADMGGAHMWAPDMGGTDMSGPGNMVPCPHGG